MIELHTATPDDHTNISHRLAIGGTGVLISILVASVVLTFPRFFLFNPLAEGDNLRAIQLSVSSIGWVLLMVGPGVVLTRYAAGHIKALAWLPFVGLLWPASLIVSHITLYLQAGVWYTGYLIQYPIFIVTDIVLPIFLVYLWEVLRPRHKLVGEGASATEEGKGQKAVSRGRHRVGS